MSWFRRPRSGPRAVFTAQEVMRALYRFDPTRFDGAGFVKDDNNIAHHLHLYANADGLVTVTQENPR